MQTVININQDQFLNLVVEKSKQYLSLWIFGFHSVVHVTINPILKKLLMVKWQSYSC